MEGFNWGHVQYSLGCLSGLLMWLLTGIFTNVSFCKSSLDRSKRLSLFSVRLITVIDVETWHLSWKWMIAKDTPSFRSSYSLPLFVCACIIWGELLLRRLQEPFLVSCSSLTLCCICAISLLYPLCRISIPFIFSAAPPAVLSSVFSLYQKHMFLTPFAF